MRRMKRTGALGALLTGTVAVAVLLIFLTAVARLDEGQSSRGRDQLEAALRRSAAACYAAEGIYPPTVDYLSKHYGIQIDEERYTVYYDIFASNLMPDITVLDNNE